MIVIKIATHEFSFHQDVVEGAQDLLRLALRDKYGLESEEKKIIFVSVHVRRTGLNFTIILETVFAPIYLC